MPEATPSTSALLLERARAGSTSSLGRLMEAYAGYLKMLVSAQLNDRLRSRVSESDVVQETFFEAHRDFPAFKGQTPAEFLGWIRRILVNNLLRSVEQHVTTAKRDVRREVSLDQLRRGVEQSAWRFSALAALGQESPSTDLQRQERNAQLSTALATLPEDYRQVIQLRHVQRLPFEQVGEQMNRSSGAARMLWLRAIKLLREQLNPEGQG